MHVLIATDGSKQSLQSAAYLRGIVDPASVTKIGVVAVISPLAAVPFASEGSKTASVETSFRREAEAAVAEVAKSFDGWGPPVSTHVYSGSPASEIVKAAKRFDSGLIVMASQSTRTQAVLMGSVSTKVLTQATCPVLVHRPGPRPSKRAKASATVKKAVPKKASPKKASSSKGSSSTKAAAKKAPAKKAPAKKSAAHKK